jgi:hypothetical protein
VESALVLRWRRATIVAAAFALLELLALAALGVYFLGRGVSQHVQQRAATPKPRAAVVVRKPPAAAPAVAHLPRSETSVLVLNGNGRAGAATARAAQLSGLGYVVGGVGDAPRLLPRTTIMYRPGFRGEAERLARDLHVRVVGPLDGLRTSQLLGAHLALVLGEDT